MRLDQIYKGEKLAKLSRRKNNGLNLMSLQWFDIINKVTK